MSARFQLPGRLRGQAGFANHIVQSLMIIVAVVLIILAIVLGQYGKYKKRANEQKALEKQQVYLTNLARLGRGETSPDKLTSVYGEQYHIIKEGNQTIIPWPDPGNWFLTAPRFVNTSGKLTFQQELPMLHNMPKGPIQISDGVLLYQKPDMLEVKAADWSFTVEIPRDGKYLAYTSKNGDRQEYNPILAALPVFAPNDGFQFRVLAMKGDQIQFPALFRVDPNYLFGLRIIHDTLFPAELSQP